MTLIYKKLRSGLQTSTGRDESQFAYEYGVILDSDSGKEVLPGRRFKPQVVLSPDKSYALVCEFETSLCFLVSLKTRESWPLDGLSIETGDVSWASNSCVKWSREIVGDVAEISKTHFLAKNKDIELTFDAESPRAHNYRTILDTEVAEFISSRGHFFFSADAFSQDAMSKRKPTLERREDWGYYEIRGNFVTLIDPDKSQIFVFSRLAFEFERDWRFS